MSYHWLLQTDCDVEVFFGCLPLDMLLTVSAVKLCRRRRDTTIHALIVVYDGFESSHSSETVFLLVFTDCNVNIHRNCVNAMQENCVGSVHKKDKTNEKFRKLKERIRPDRDPKRRVSSNWSSM